MKRTGWNNTWRIAGLLLALAALSFGPHPRAASATGLYSYNFEESVKPWAAGTDSLLTLDRSGNVCPLEHGTGMALVTNPGGLAGFANQLAYMGASFPANAGDSVTVDWAAKMPAISGRTSTPVVYIGTPGSPAQDAFVFVKGTPGAYGWTNYHYVTNIVSTGASDAVYIALGVINKQQILGTAVGIDCVFVTITANTN